MHTTSRNPYSLLGLLLHCVACASTTTVVDADAGTDEEVQLHDGRVSGVSDGNTRSFIGIPFAAPPVGELRWRPPAAAKPWEGVLDASGPGVSCMQFENSLYTEITEDCLKLNVFAPHTKPEKPLPVLVWLYGGSHRTGSANQLIYEGLPRIYDGARLRAGAPRDVIVVTVNYRLGSLGFLAHPALSAEQGGSSGNYGLMDQQAALRWVHENVAAFGGDPSNVTLFGQSAGSVSACYQTLKPENEGLFQRAIFESGGCTLRIDPLHDSEIAGRQLAESRGCVGDSAEALECLRSLPADKAMQSRNVIHEGAPFLRSPDPDAAPQWGDINRITNVTVDGKFLTEQPIAALKAGRFLPIPSIVGTTSLEGSTFQLEGSSRESAGAFSSEPNYLASIHNTFRGAADRVADRYSVERYGSVVAASIALVTDLAFVCPARTHTRLMSRNTDVYLYNWDRTVDHGDNERLGPSHSAELAWVWNVWSVLGRADHAAEVTQVLDYWTAFADTADPNNANAPQWPKYDADIDPELVFGKEVRVENGRRNQICPFWDEIFAELWGDDWKDI